MRQPSSSLRRKTESECAVPFAMTDEKVPDWLPDGWIFEVREGKGGRKYRYYIYPETGDTFTTKDAVLCFLNGADVDSSAMNPIIGFKDVCPQALYQKVIDLINWLPSGWLMEIRVLNNVPKAGQYYKCYIDKSTGMTFSSKEDVLHFVSTGENCNSIPDKESDKHESDYHVLVQIEYSPDGLPREWIQKSRFGEKNSQRYLYYSDPASGYVFRTAKDVSWYVEDGILGKHAYQPRTRNLHNLLALEQESPGDIKFLTNILLNPDMLTEIGEPVSPSLDCNSSQISKDAVAAIKPVRRQWKRKTLKRRLHALLKKALEEKEEGGNTTSHSDASAE